MGLGDTFDQDDIDRYYNMMATNLKQAKKLQSTNENITEWKTVQ